MGKGEPGTVGIHLVKSEVEAAKAVISRKAEATGGAHPRNTHPAVPIATACEGLHRNHVRFVFIEQLIKLVVHEGIVSIRIAVLSPVWSGGFISVHDKFFNEKLDIELVLVYVAGLDYC